MLIRAERPTDYADIAALHARAFHNKMGEPLVVTIQRQCRTFDPTLSLVAESAGRVVGHVLFIAHQMRLLDQSIPVVTLGPIGVLPEQQGQGIGGRLITEGHAAMAARGFLLSVLLGHPTYYPRFGYQTNAFGRSEVTLTVQTPAGAPLEARNPYAEDVEKLTQLWQIEEHGVDMAVQPGPDLLDWLSPNPAIKAAVYLREGAIVGYTRIHRDEKTKPLVFLACDSAAAQAMLATMASQLSSEGTALTYTLPLHPFSASTAGLGKAQTRTMEAAMVYELAPSPFPDYLAALREGRRPPGRLIWPVSFDLNE